MSQKNSSITIVGSFRVWATKNESEIPNSKNWATKLDPTWCGCTQPEERESDIGMEILVEE